MNNLFELVKSMSKNEKRHFKLFYSTYSKGEKSNYVKLFDAIDRLRNYDNDKLLKLLNDKKIAGRLAVEKSFLYRLILGSLRHYYAEKSVDSILKNSLLEAKILFNRRLFKQCEKILIRSEKIAIENEKYETLIEIARFYFGLYHRKYHFTDNRTLDTIYERLDSTVNMLNNLIKYKRLQDSYFQISKRSHHFARKRNEAREMRKIISHPLLKDKKSALSDSAKRIFYMLHAKYELSKRNYKEAGSYFLQQVMLSKIKAEKGVVDPNEHIGDKYNYLVTLLMFEKDVAVVKKGLFDFRSLSEKYSKMGIEREIRRLITYDSYFLELGYYTQNGLFEEAKSVSEAFEIKIIKEKDFCINPIESGWFYLGVLYFGLQDYVKSLHYFNMILNDPLSEEREDIACAAKIMILIVYYETENTDLMHYAVRSTYRYLMKRERVHPTEKILIDFIRKKMDKIFSKKDLTSELLIVEKKLIATFRKYPAEESFIKYFDIISWLRSKIENKSFAEIVRQRQRVLPVLSCRL